MKKHISVFKIILPAILACLLWSTAFAGVKIGLNYCPPLLFAGIRFFISGLLLIPFVILNSHRRKLEINKRILGINIFTFKQWRIVLIVSFFQTFLLYTLYFYGVSIVPAAIAAIVIGGGPLIISVTAHFLANNDKMTRPKISCILLGMAGIVIITLDKSPLTTGGSYLQIIGILMLLVSCIAGGIGNILVSKYKTCINPITLTSFQMIFGGLMLFIASLLVNGTPKIDIKPEFIIALLWLSIVSATAFSIWFKLLQIRIVKVSELNIWKFIIPVFGGIFSWIIIPDEHPTVIIIIGMAITASAVLLYNIYVKKLATKK
ncbi:MAG: EamA family transporter [bacterium]|nr:EamA family transporter [bacterium]